MNYYEMLGISEKASEEIIESAYKYKSTTVNDENERKKIDEAYAVLSDKEKRKAYDSNSLTKHTKLVQAGVWVRVCVAFGNFSDCSQSGPISS